VADRDARQTRMVEEGKEGGREARLTIDPAANIRPKASPIAGDTPEPFMTGNSHRAIRRRNT
jgi:hypothetical protein